MVDALYRRGVFLTVGWQVSLGVRRRLLGTSLC
jgi:hypothetical protein